MVLMSVATMGFGVLAIVHDVYGSAFSHRALWALVLFATLLGGVWLGMFITLVLAGQLLYEGPKQLQDSR
jgi:hypothetical protein